MPNEKELSAERNLLIEQQIAIGKKMRREHYRELNRYVNPGQIVLVGSSLMEGFPIYEFMLDFDLP